MTWNRQAIIHNAKFKPFNQVGGVWTPVSERGQGYARMVVAGSLQHATEQGYSMSVLFTDDLNIGAQKAYESLGYKHIGEFGLYMVDN